MQVVSPDVRITSAYGADRVTVPGQSGGGVDVFNTVRLVADQKVDNPDTRGDTQQPEGDATATLSAEESVSVPSAVNAAQQPPPPVQSVTEAGAASNNTSDHQQAYFVLSNPQKRRFSPYPSSTREDEEENVDDQGAGEPERPTEQVGDTAGVNLNVSEPEQPQVSGEEEQAPQSENSLQSVYNMFFGGGSKGQASSPKGRSSNNSEDWNDESALASAAAAESDDNDFSERSRRSQQSPKRDPEVERIRLLSRAFRLQRDGAEFTKPVAEMSPDELRADIFRLEEDRDREQSVKFSRRLLLAMISGLEVANEKFNPIGLRLNGWSEHMMSSVEEYDPVLEKLHAKYNRKVEMPPEMEFVSMIAGSALMFHLTSSIYRPDQPNMSRLAQENPEMMRDWAHQQQSRSPTGRGGGGGGMPGMPDMAGLGGLGDLLGMPSMPGMQDARSPFGLPSGGRMARMADDTATSSAVSEDDEDEQEPPPAVQEDVERTDTDQGGVDETTDDAGSESVTVRTVNVDGKRTMRFDD